MRGTAAATWPDPMRPLCDCKTRPYAPKINGGVLDNFDGPCGMTLIEPLLEWWTGAPFGRGVRLSEERVERELTGTVRLATEK